MRVRGEDIPGAEEKLGLDRPRLGEGAGRGGDGELRCRGQVIVVVFWFKGSAQGGLLTP